MKNLNQVQLNLVSGGEKFLAITTNIDISGVPTSCVERFFQNNNNITLVGLTEDVLSSTLFSNCTDYKISNTNHVSFYSNNIDMRVIEK